MLQRNKLPPAFASCCLLSRSVKVAERSCPPLSLSGFSEMVQANWLPSFTTPGVGCRTSPTRLRYNQPNIEVVTSHLKEQHPHNRYANIWLVNLVKKMFTCFSTQHTHRFSLPSQDEEGQGGLCAPDSRDRVVRANQWSEGISPWPSSPGV